MNFSFNDGTVLRSVTEIIIYFFRSLDSSCFRFWTPPWSYTEVYI